MVKKSHTTSANYLLIRSNPKEERIIDYTILPQVKEIILQILKDDKKYWKELGEHQMGIERNNLINKVCSRINTPSEVFELALEELELEQKVLPSYLDNMSRYIYLDLGNNI